MTTHPNPPDISDERRALEAIAEISEVLLATLDMDALFQRLLEALARHFQLTHSMVMLPRGQALEVVAAHGASKTQIGHEAPIGVGLAGVAAQRRRTVSIGNMRVQKRYLRAMMSGGDDAPRSEITGLPSADSRIAVPLVVEGELVAVLMGESERPAVFTQQDAANFHLLTTQIAAAIRNAQMIQKLEVSKLAAEAARHEAESALLELRAAQKALIQSEKLASLGQLAAGIAHEVNTPLGAIMASVSPMMHIPAAVTRLVKRREVLDDTTWERLMDAIAAPGRDLGVGTAAAFEATAAMEEHLDELGLDDADELADMLIETGLVLEMHSVQELLKGDVSPEDLKILYTMRSMTNAAQTIETAADKARKVVLALKSYVHEPSREADRSNVDLQQSVNTVLTVYQNMLKHGINVDFRHDPQGDWSVLASPERLIQVWTNIIHNAIQAMDGQGHIRIQLREHGDDVCVEIANDGPPIPDEVLPRLFEPFFTTKPLGQGTGLGLHLCTQIVAAHNGTLTAHHDAQWTVFQVTLPRTH